MVCCYYCFCYSALSARACTWLRRRRADKMRSDDRTWYIMVCAAWGILKSQSGRGATALPTHPWLSWVTEHIFDHLPATWETMLARAKAAKAWQAYVAHGSSLLERFANANRNFPEKNTKTQSFCFQRVVRPISLLTSSLLRLLDSNFPGNPPSLSLYIYIYI